MELSQAIKHYKFPNGAANFNKLLCIPLNDRLPSLVAREGVEKIHRLLGGAVHLAMESLNLSDGLSANQTFDLVDNILDSATEDYLGLEDIVLFLQKLVRGEAGKMYKHMDIATFMELFEKYRQQRHEEFLRVREEQHAQYKGTGTGPRSKLDRGANMDMTTFDDLLKTYNDSKNDKSMPNDL